MARILIIDDNCGLLPRLTKIAPEQTFSLVQTVAEARRSMVHEKPSAVLYALQDIDCGISFARSLRDHPSFSAVPFFLFFEPDSYSTLIDSADAFIKFSRIPFTDQTLREDLREILPESSEPRAAESKATPLSPPLTPQVDLFQSAQRLLAQVLHNLKTSNLLELLDPADLPDTVLEMTRKVCENEKNRGSRPELSTVLRSRGRE